jgi:hypothetical protein
MSKEKDGKKKIICGKSSKHLGSQPYSRAVGTAKWLV